MVLGPVIAERGSRRRGRLGDGAHVGGVGSIVGAVLAIRDPSGTAARRLHARRGADRRSARRARARSAALGARRDLVRRLGRDRRPPDALVHRLPAAGARARPVAGQLVRHARLVRARPARARARRAGGLGAWGRRRRSGSRSRSCSRPGPGILALPSVWAIRRREPEPELGPCLTTMRMSDGRMSVRVRMAPSPTGFLHIGSVRTFLFNWLYARGRGGECLLRIENTDVSREVAAAVEQIQRSLEWIGIDWDGAVTFQLDRIERCHEEAHRLVEPPAPPTRTRARSASGCPTRGRPGWDDAGAAAGSTSRTPSSRTSSSFAPTAGRPTTSPRPSRTGSTGSRT